MEANSKDYDNKMCISFGVVKMMTKRVNATRKTGKDIKQQNGYFCP
jgi:hypothetical protein